jgi:hypothetical protein
MILLRLGDPAFEKQATFLTISELLIKHDFLDFIVRMVLALEPKDTAVDTDPPSSNKTYLARRCSLPLTKCSRYHKQQFLYGNGEVLLQAAF